MKDAKLIASIQDLIGLLRQTGSKYGVNELTGIVTDLVSEKQASNAGARLEQMFGGMGTLNDLIFCEENQNLPSGEKAGIFNKRYCQLLDRTFKEMRLRNEGVIARLHWAYLELRHRGELPPRIKKTFRQRSKLQ